MQTKQKMIILMQNLRGNLEQIVRIYIQNVSPEMVY